jgi:hypothetical protein
MHSLCLLSHINLRYFGYGLCKYCGLSCDGLFGLVEPCDEALFSFVECFENMLACFIDVAKELRTRVFDLLCVLLQSNVHRFIESAVLQVLYK